MNLLPRLRVSKRDPHLLATDGEDLFFLLGDTVWERFHRLTPAEAEYYFQKRAAQGFNLVCAVALAEFDGLHTPNALGDLPLHGDDPRRPNDAYFAAIDAQIAQAAAQGLLLPGYTCGGWYSAANTPGANAATVECGDSTITATFNIF